MSQYYNLYSIAYVVFTKGHDARCNETEPIDLHVVVYAFTKTTGSAFHYNLFSYAVMNVIMS